MKHRRKLMTVSVLLALAALSIVPSAVLPVASQDSDACPEIVLAALAATDEMCSGTGRDQACYGHMVLEAQPQPQVDQLQFEQEGDIESISRLRTLRLSTMDMDTEAWGIALMRLQANLPEANLRQNITLLLFGDVEIHNAASLSPLHELNVTATSNVNVRDLPSQNAKIIGRLFPRQTVIATGRLEDNSWLRIRLPDTGATGWVAGWLVNQGEAVEALEVVEASSKYYGPMQAFYFRSGIDDSACPEAPSSGLLIQTPEGAGEVTLLINEVDIQLGSTVYFQAEPGSAMTVSVVEGSATVTAFDVTFRAVAGTQISVPIDTDLKSAAAPNPPVPYDMSLVAALPISLLERDVVIAAPLTEEEVLVLVAEQLAENQAEAEAGMPEDNNANFDPDALPPGIDSGFVAPGQEGGSLPPGQDPDFIPPGQGKK